MAERYNYIDFLRFIGLTLIILAHVQAPHTITQMRCFDVPLMVFVSGLSFSGKSLKASCRSFYWPRIKRLIIPVYIFITLYLLLWVAIGDPFSLKESIGSYLLLEDNSIKYVWIIKVFLLIMLITPLLIRINTRVNTWQFIVLIIGLLILQEIIVHICGYYATAGLIGHFIKESAYSIVGYSIPFLVGLRVRFIENKSNLLMALCAILLMSIAVVLYYYLYGFPIDISPRFKYPPYRYFIIYGVCVSLLLWVSRDFLKFLSDNKCVLFVGQNTIWLYLWHIPFVYIANSFIDGWAIRYVFVYFGAFVVFFLQFVIVNKISKKKDFSLLKYFKG